MPVITGIDIGIVNLSVCQATYGEDDARIELLPKLTITHWEIIDLGTKKLEESVAVIAKKLGLFTHYMYDSDVVIIERQVGINNPKMLAISHVIQTLLELGRLRDRRPPVIMFENASCKFSRMKSRGFVFPCDTKDPKYNTAAKKRTATKNNAIYLAEMVLLANEARIHYDTFKRAVKKVRENKADSLGLIVGYLATDA